MSKISDVLNSATEPGQGIEDCVRELVKAVVLIDQRLEQIESASAMKFKAEMKFKAPPRSLLSDIVEDE